MYSHTAQFIKAAYQELIAGQRHDIQFWVLCSFLPTFLVARLLVYLAPQIFVQIGNTHIHHLAWGIILLAIAGYASLVARDKRSLVGIAIFYGIGLALAFNEFGMWLRLEDSYWIRQSYDVVLIILAWLINAVYFSQFWVRIVKYLMHSHGKKKFEVIEQSV